VKALIQEDNGPGLRIAPLIDIVFLLLIFFLVATTFYEAEKDIVVRLAEATQGQAREKSPRLVVVNVRESGVLVVDQRVMSLDALDAFLREAHESNRDMVVVVRCDRHARHKHFVRVLNLCEKIGVTGVAVATFHTEE
jgi:biopolymer transport protein ExbD